MCPARAPLLVINILSHAGILCHLYCASYTPTPVPTDRGVVSIQAMDVTEALREATEYTRTLSSPEAFLVVMAELLADGFEVRQPGVDRSIGIIGACDG